jgi:hypothetical protein
MSGKYGKEVAALALSVLILIAAALFARFVKLYVAESWRDYALWALCAVIAVFVLLEAHNIAYFFRALDRGNHREQRGSASMLALLGEDGAEIRYWDLKGRIGVVIGRGQDSEDARIDLSDTEYFTVISQQHAVLNYTNRGWYLADAGSKNGTALARQGSDQKLRLAPGESIPIKPGDIIYIAESTALAVR